LEKLDLSLRMVHWSTRPIGTGLIIKARRSIESVLTRYTSTYCLILRSSISRFFSFSRSLRSTISALLGYSGGRNGEVFISLLILSLIGKVLNFFADILLLQQRGKELVLSPLLSWLIYHIKPTSSVIELTLRPFITFFRVQC